MIFFAIDVADYTGEIARTKKDKWVQVVPEFDVLIFFRAQCEISDHQQSWGYEDGPWKGPGPSLLVAADF